MAQRRLKTLSQNYFPKLTAYVPPDHLPVNEMNIPWFPVIVGLPISDYPVLSSLSDPSQPQQHIYSSIKSPEVHIRLFMYLGTRLCYLANVGAFPVHVLVSIPLHTKAEKSRTMPPYDIPGAQTWMPC
jgi:hypothetical protein